MTHDPSTAHNTPAPPQQEEPIPFILILAAIIWFACGLNIFSGPKK